MHCYLQALLYVSLFHTFHLGSKDETHWALRYHNTQSDVMHYVPLGRRPRKPLTDSYPCSCIHFTRKLIPFYRHSLLGSIDETLLGLLEVDDVPDSLQVLQHEEFSVSYIGNFTGTYVGFDVLVLEIERVFPDVDADDGYVC